MNRVKLQRRMEQTKKMVSETDPHEHISLRRKSYKYNGQTAGTAVALRKPEQQGQQRRKRVELEPITECAVF